MNYGSFYGGRRGTSFIIAKSYPDIISMTNDFAEGNDFLDVAYDEYVLINTVNKNHPDNGKLFRRGYDYNSNRTISGTRAYDSNGDEIINGTQQQYLEATYSLDNNIPARGAVYIGTIVGPSGRGSLLSFVSYDKVEEYKNNTPDTRKMGGSGTAELIPGKDSQGNYNDDILWNSVSIISNNHESSTAYIGFKIPYPVIDFEIKEITPYQQSEIVRIDDQTHPFYEKWSIAIPPGKFGNAVISMKKINTANYFSDDSTITDFLPPIYSTPQSNEAMSIEDFEAAGIQEGDDIIVYQYKDYTNNADLTKTKLCYLAPHKQIENININSGNGTLTVSYTDNKVDTFENAISAVKQLSFTNGVLRIKYNTGQEVNIDIIYIDKVLLKDDGILAYKKNIEDPNFDLEAVTADDTDHVLGIIKWIDNIQYDNTSKILRINYNTENAQNISIPYISDITFLEDGTVQIRKGGDDWENVTYTEGGQTKDRVLKWIDNITYNRDNDSVQIFYNTDKERPGTIFSNVFNRILRIEFQEDVSFDDGSTGPGFIISYADESTDKIHFSTGHLIKSMSIVSGEPEESEGGETTYSNSKLAIQYTDNSVEELDLNGKLISNMSFVSDEGTDIPTSNLIVTYDNQQTQSLNFVYPRSAIVEDSTIEDSHKIKFYDSLGQQMSESNPITGIESVIIDENNRLLVLYNNPTARDSIPDSRAVVRTGLDGTTLTWDDLGLVRTNSGLLISKNLKMEQIQPVGSEQPLTIDQIIAYLNENYTDGQVNGSLYRIITIGQDLENKQFYGFDTEKATWYLLGSIPEAIPGSKDCVCGTLEDFNSTFDVKKYELITGGLFFIVKDDEEVEEESEPIYDGDIPDEEDIPEQEEPLSEEIDEEGI